MTNALTIALYLIPLVEGYRGIDGDGGNSWGKYQISQACLDDVNDITGCNYTKEDCYDPEIARRICIIYLHYWGKKIGHQPSARDFVRIWNGGPDGWKETCTLSYWYKCRIFMYVAIAELKRKKSEEKA